MSEWHTWIGQGRRHQLLDPLNWKDGRVPPERGARVFVPSGSHIPAANLPDIEFDALFIEPDPEDAKVKTRIGRRKEDAT